MMGSAKLRLRIVMNSNHMLVRLHEQSVVSSILARHYGTPLHCGAHFDSDFAERLSVPSSRFFPLYGGGQEELGASSFHC